MPPPPRKSPPQAPATPSAPPKSYKVSVRPVVDREPVVLINAVEGWGKTSVGAHAPAPLILQSGNETGYDTLVSNGLVPEVPSVIIDDWADTIGWVRSLTADPQGIKSLVLDAIGGFEMLARRFVCNRDFKGNWGESGFASYGKGFENTAREWTVLIEALERLRDTQGVRIILLGHVRIEKFENPTGVNYSRYMSDVHQKIWASTAKFCDAVLFGQFYQVTESDRANASKGIADKRGKAIGDAQRVVISERRDGFDAKNRYAMPGEIWIEGGADAMYAEIFQHINRGK